MPRTKRPVARKEKIAEPDENLRNLDKLLKEQQKRIDVHAEMELRNLEVAFKILLGSIHSEDLNKTVGQLKTEMQPKEIATSRVTRNSTRSSSHDDGYLTENSSQGSSGLNAKRQIPVLKSSSRATGRRSRSADTTSRLLHNGPSTAAKAVQRRRSRSLYKTPAFNRYASVNYPVITPKVNPQTPLTVLRQPRQGEMVVSMSGSPVMVPSCYTLNPDEMANCNIMLQDGTMLSLQPRKMRESQVFLPFSLMDPNVLAQLKTLKENLGHVVRCGEKEIK